jgi:hypothetical protein
MSPELAKLTILIAAVAVLVGLTLVLQSRRISDVWLHWIPRTVREPISLYFDPPPSVHPNLPDPNKMKSSRTQSAARKIAASSLRILLSAAHGLHDLEHYLLRFFIAFVVALLMMLALLALIAGITSL